MTKKKKYHFTIATKRKRRIIRMARNTKPEDKATFQKYAMRKYRAFIRDLAKEVLERRTKLNMSHRTLAARIGIHYNTLYNLESEAKVSADSLFQICTYLDIEIKFEAKRMRGERKYLRMKEEDEAKNNNPSAPTTTEEGKEGQKP